MNVLWVAPGGLEPSSGELIPALYQLLEAMGERVSLTAVTFEPTHGRPEFLVETTPVFAVGRPDRSGPLNLRAAWQQMSRLHRVRPFDRVHGFWGTRAAVLAVAWGRAHRVPVLVSLFGGEPVNLPELDYGGWRSARSRAALRWVVSHADRVTAGSPSLIERLRAVGLEAPWIRWSIGIDQTPFRAVADARPSGRIGPSVLLSVADLGPIKDHPTQLELMARLRHWRSVVLRIAGDLRPTGTLDPLIHALELEECVEVLGKVPHEALPNLYRHADLLIHTSRHEGEGIVFLEAAAAGCPIVSTAVGLIPEMAARGAASMAPVGDAAGLARAVERLLDHPALRLEQARRAQAYAAAFDLAPVADTLMALYHDM